MFIGNSLLGYLLSGMTGYCFRARVSPSATSTAVCAHKIGGAELGQQVVDDVDMRYA